MHKWCLHALSVGSSVSCFTLRTSASSTSGKPKAVPRFMAPLALNGVASISSSDSSSVVDSVAAS